MTINLMGLCLILQFFAIRNLITTALETEKYKYHVAKNGNQAIIEAATQPPELILLDLGLPDIDGIDVIKKIRSWSTVPITVISARSDDKDKIDALDAGADDYITKPFSTAELLARIRGNYRRIQYIQNNQQGTTPVFHNGSLTIDYQMQTVYVKEEEMKVRMSLHGVRLPYKNLSRLPKTRKRQLRLRLAQYLCLIIHRLLCILYLLREIQDDGLSSIVEGECWDEY